MSETDPAIIGIQSCGCVTLAIARPDRTLPAKERREEDRAMAEIIHNGGEIRRTTVGEARKMENFLPVRCPHKPKGWKPLRRHHKVPRTQSTRKLPTGPTR